MNILHAAQALGFGAVWLTEWPAFDKKILKALGGKKGDRIAGFIYIGTDTEPQEDRARPALRGLPVPGGARAGHRPVCDRLGTQTGQRRTGLGRILCGPDRGASTP